ncbi:MAG: family transcriptional regulator, cyclic receptor protein [Actinomycetota bacterium]|jgi:CRP/FNR family transcriptional regulator, cyclic AMP receptor protein|nr:family transcriptional regulator, cyclic receptor protein [Actinomycetota bacterium]
MKVETIATHLAATRLFGELDPAALSSLAERAVERTYKKGQLLVYQGDSGDSLFVIIEGLVKVMVTSEEGEEMVLVTLRPSDTFGELSLVDGGPRSASAEAVEPTRVLIITRAILLELLGDHPSLTDSLLRSLGSLARRLTEQAADLVFLDIHGRMAKLLLSMADQRGKQTESGVVLDLNLTQADLAAMVGGSRQSVNQTLRSFESRGYLEIEGRSITLRKPDELRRRAGL